ncbi:MAG: sugar transferase [Planctomycetes bacterium]|nr:sugar transferase [Planctomycetota bacterium]
MRFLSSLFRRRARSSHEPQLHLESREILNRERFVAAMRRERDLADRHGLGASVVLVQLPTERRDLAAEVFRYLERRMRDTDTMGWFDESTPGVLLPCTDSAGAWSVAIDVGLLLRSNGIESGVRVLTQASQVEQRRKRDGDDDDRRGTGAPEANAHLPAEPLSAFLVQPTPSWKRAIDIAGAGLGLVLLAPVLLGIALAVRLDSRGPVLFRQRRVGRGGRIFHMLKFRSMVVDAEAQKARLAAQNEASGPVFKMKHDPRITRVGRVLRKWSLDELPQLWNVVVGDMSLVGPRPPTPDEVRHYRPWQRRRLELTGGLTCFWQTSGRSDVSFEDWVRMDLRYARERSPWTDSLILARTVPAVLGARGAY